MSGGLAIEVGRSATSWAGVLPDAEAVAYRAADAAWKAAGSGAAELSILLSDDAQIQVLNRDYRGEDKPTNVLSCPAADTPATQGHLGDIVIAYETLRRECEDEGREFLHHLAHLTVHGFLHLIGYDHETDAQADEMETLESRIMNSMNMPDPWRDAHLARDLQHGDA